VDAIRELTGHAGAIDVGLDLGDDDGLLEGDDGLSDDDGEEEAPRRGSHQGQLTRNPALMRAAPQHMSSVEHPYAYGHESGASALPKVSAASHNALREALLGGNSTTAQRNPEVKIEPGTGTFATPRGASDSAYPSIDVDVSTDDLLIESDLAFEEMWADGVWGGSMDSLPSPVSMMMREGESSGRGGLSRSRMPRNGSSSRLRDLDEYGGMPAGGGLPRNPSFDRLQGMGHGMSRDRSYDRLDRISDRMSRERSYDLLQNAMHAREDHRLERSGRPLGSTGRTMSTDHLDRLVKPEPQIKHEGDFKGEVDMDEFSPLNSSSVGDPLGMPMATGEHGGMRRNVSSNSLRDYLEGGTGTTMREINRERYSGMTKSSSHNSLSELIGRPQHGMPRNGSRGNLAAMGMPRNGSRGNLSAMDRDDNAEVTLGDTMFVF